MPVQILSLISFPHRISDEDTTWLASLMKSFPYPFSEREKVWLRTWVMMPKEQRQALEDLWEPFIGWLR